MVTATATRSKLSTTSTGAKTSIDSRAVARVSSTSTCTRRRSHFPSRPSPPSTSALGPSSSPAICVRLPREASPGGSRHPRPRSQHPHRPSPEALFASTRLDRHQPHLVPAVQNWQSSDYIECSLRSVLYAPAFFVPSNKVSLRSRAYNYCPRCASKTPWCNHGRPNCSKRIRV